MWLCSLVARYQQRLGETYSLHLLRFRPEGGDSTFLRHVGIYLQAYAALQSITLTLSKDLLVMRFKIMFSQVECACTL